MTFPPLENSQRYRGLYVFDFGQWSSVGYTAEEIALLLESEQYREGKVYRIHQAYPDGRLELQGVSAARFQYESGMMFVRGDAAEARADYDELRAAAERVPPPSRAALYLAEYPRGATTNDTWVTALIYPAEYDAEVAAWLTQIGFCGGDSVEGGVSHVTDFQNAAKEIVARCQLVPSSRLARSREEIYASVRRKLQR